MSEYNNILYKLLEHEKDKRLAELTGLSIKELCSHEWVSGSYMVKHCKKCGVLCHD